MERVAAVRHLLTVTSRRSVPPPTAPSIGNGVGVTIQGCGFVGSDRAVFAFSSTDVGSASSSTPSFSFDADADDGGVVVAGSGANVNDAADDEVAAFVDDPSPSSPVASIRCAAVAVDTLTSCASALGSPGAGADGASPACATATLPASSAESSHCIAVGAAAAAPDSAVAAPGSHPGITIAKTSLSAINLTAALRTALSVTCVFSCAARCDVFFSKRSLTIRFRTVNIICRGGERVKL